MLNISTCIQPPQKNKKSQHIRRTVLSFLISWLFCSAAPTLAACVNEGTNDNGGVNITCKEEFNTNLFGNSNNNNIVTTYGSITTPIYGSYQFSGAKIQSGSNNMLIVNDTHTSAATGAKIVSYSSTGTAVTANKNNVIVNDSLLSDAIGATADSTSVSGNGDKNTVTLNNSHASGVVTGASFSSSGNSNDGDITLNNNVVTLNNSRASYVYGASYSGSANNIIMNNNYVNINGTSDVVNSLFGAVFDLSNATSPPISYDYFTGNTLNFAAGPITTGVIGNFEHYNFTIDPALVNTNTALITARTITFGTNDTNLKGGEANTSKIKVVGIKAGNELFADDKFVLLQATDTMSGDAEGLTTSGVAQQGISLLYDVETSIDTDAKQVTATILGKEEPVNPVSPETPADSDKPAATVNPQLKALSEGHLASAMMLTRGADTLAYNTVHTIQHQNPDKGLAPFITLSGGKTRYNSSSHIDAKDGRLTGGLSYLTDNLVSAVLIESGWGSYNTHNSFDAMNDVDGDGHNRYAGAAVLGHYDFESGVFAEASLRAGKNHNTFDTRDIVNLNTGERAHYNLDSNYLGAHIGTGYSKALDEKNTADVSAKYLWTQLKGKDVKVAGDNIHFDDINSHRIRLDAGLSHQYTEAVAVRAGLGYEYEFDGKANATTYAYDIAAPGVQGSTAILTLGSTVTPLAGQPLSVDINLNGYTGKRDGVGGSLKFSYAF